MPRERNTFLFSATMSSKVESLQRASLREPARISVKDTKYQTVKTLIQNYIFIPLVHKDTYLVWLLANEFPGQSAVIFTRTVNETQRIAILLRTLGLGAVPLHGQLSQTNRLGALNKFKGGARNILVATDVAARGLDIPNVDVSPRSERPDVLLKADRQLCRSWSTMICRVTAKRTSTEWAVPHVLAKPAAPSAL